MPKSQHLRGADLRDIKASIEEGRAAATANCLNAGESVAISRVQRPGAVCGRRRADRARIRAFKFDRAPPTPSGWHETFTGAQAVTETHGTLLAAEAIDADIDAACNYPPAPPDRLLRISAHCRRHRPAPAAHITDEVINHARSAARRRWSRRSRRRCARRRLSRP